MTVLVILLGFAFMSWLLLLPTGRLAGLGWDRLLNHIAYTSGRRPFYSGTQREYVVSFTDVVDASNAVLKMNSIVKQYNMTLQAMSTATATCIGMRIPL